MPEMAMALFLLLLVLFALQARYCIRVMAERTLGDQGFERDYSYVALLVISAGILLQAAKALEIPWLEEMSSLLESLDDQMALSLILAIACQALFGLWFGNMRRLMRLDPPCVALYAANLIVYLVLVLLPTERTGS